jgi:hypothetical protein
MIGGLYRLWLVIVMLIFRALSLAAVEWKL